MANTRKSRVPKEEQLKLINECRTSGMTDTDWCREHGIAVSTFYCKRQIMRLVELTFLCQTLKNTKKLIVF